MSKEAADDIEALRLACMVCESGAALERYRHITFEDNQVRAFNGIVSLQAPFALDADRFAVNEERLERALSACEGEGLTVSSTKEFLVFKKKPLTIRVRKIDSDTVFTERLSAPKVAERKDASSLQEALAKVSIFVSADASRPWSTAAFVSGDKFIYATNNLSLARSPCVIPLACKIPSPAIPILLALPGIDWIAREPDTSQICVGYKRTVLSFPEHEGDWPDVAAFFKDKPKKLPDLDEDLLNAAKTMEKFTDRFISLSDKSIEGKTATLESEYEVQVKKGRGTYSAKLLSLVLSVAQRGDFSTYPKPVFFEGEGIEGIAVGVAPSQAGEKAAA